MLSLSLSLSNLLFLTARSVDQGFINCTVRFARLCVSFIASEIEANRPRLGSKPCKCLSLINARERISRNSAKIKHIHMYVYMMCLCLCSARNEVIDNAPAPLHAECNGVLGASRRMRNMPMALGEVQMFLP